MVKRRNKNIKDLCILKKIGKWISGRSNYKMSTLGFFCVSTLEWLLSRFIVYKRLPCTLSLSIIDQPGQQDFQSIMKTGERWYLLCATAKCFCHRCKDSSQNSTATNQQTMKSLANFTSDLHASVEMHSPDLAGLKPDQMWFPGDSGGSYSGLLSGAADFLTQTKGSCRSLGR